MKIASWNVNSVKARLGLIVDWLRVENPDFLLMQEIKCETQAFPLYEFSSLGYEVSLVGQKSYNGVAILSRNKPDIRALSLPDDETDMQARYIEIEAAGVVLVNVYVPNGNPVESEKYPYKLRWLHRLQNRLKALYAEGRAVIIGGDFNIIPEALDCFDAAAWQGDALFRPEVRALWRSFCHIGYIDAFRALHPAEKAYSFWDYQQNAFARNAGIRIDHFLLSPEAADRLQDCKIDITPRGLTQPSDHTPIIINLS